MFLNFDKSQNNLEMTLITYNQKSNFDSTGEPRGRSRKFTKRFDFCHSKPCFITFAL